MNKNDVIYGVKRLLEEKTGESFVVEPRVIKGTEAIFVRKETDNTGTVYYPDKMGNLTTKEIVENIVEHYMNADIEEVKKIANIGSYLCDFEAVKDKLTVQLLDREKAMDKLIPGGSNVVYGDFLDLAALIRIPVDGLSMGNASVAVTADLLEKWGMDFSEVLEIAKQNMAKEFQEINMLSFLNEMTGMDMDMGMGIGMPPMHILTNESKINGAAVIMNEDIMKKIGEQYGTVAVIPSSIHEVIILPVDGLEEEVINNINDMIMEINETQVEPKDRLSNHVYLYENGRGWQYEGMENSEHDVNEDEIER